jgi:4-hydroxy-2-oxoheptanedioate aldolase
MKLVKNPFVAALQAGRKQVGFWNSLPSNYVAEVLAGAGYDWILVDMEHSPGDVMSVLGQLQAIAPYTTGIVRLPWNDTVMVKRLLDIGAQGLLFPMIQSVAEAEAAVRACHYPPKGVRGVAGSLRGNRFGRVTDYYDRVGVETAVLLQLETRAAVALADDIAAVDGVTGVFFGPADIGADMGILGKPMDPVIWDLILPVAQRLIGKGVRVGTLVSDPAFAIRLLNDGFSFVACGTDAGMLAKGTDALLAEVRGGIKD